MVTHHIQKSVFWFLIVGGIFFLMLAAHSIYKEVPDLGQTMDTKVYDAKYRVIDITPESITAGLSSYKANSVASALEMVDSDYLALFILNSKVCVPCITEVHEYIDICSTNGTTSITPWVLVTESDTTNALPFLMAADFTAPAFYGFSPILDSLLTFIDGNRIP